LEHENDVSGFKSHGDKREAAAFFDEAGCGYDESASLPPFFGGLYF